MINAAAVLIYLPSPSGFGGMGDTGKFHWGCSVAPSFGFVSPCASAAGRAALSDGAEESDETTLLVVVDMARNGTEGAVQRTEKAGRRAIDVVRVGVYDKDKSARGQMQGLDNREKPRTP